MRSYRPDRLKVEDYFQLGIYGLANAPERLEFAGDGVVLEGKFAEKFTREFREGETETGAGRDRPCVDDCATHTGVIVGEYSRDRMVDELADQFEVGIGLVPAIHEQADACFWEAEARQFLTAVFGESH